jgi:crotonobetainyl-CoA:carnitine CoA-transferase CaiB-like acyl-CoA transferase
MTAANYQQPYAGLRILDLSQGVAAPHAGMLFAQYGADVVKVEPTAGDWVRGLGAAHGDHSALSITYNVGKRSIALDLKSPEGVEVVLRLADRADLVLESFRPGVVDRLGVGYDVVSARNPSVIYASVSGFGQHGPYRDRPCTDTVAQAYTGFMSANEGTDGVPHKVGIIIMDAVCGVYAFGALTAALAGRGASGEGRYLDLSLTGAGVAIQAPKVAEFHLEGGAPQRLNSPAGTYRTADGWIAITLTKDMHFQKLCDAIGMSHLPADPRFDSFVTRARHHEDLVALLTPVIEHRTTSAWREIFHASDVLAERIVDHGQWLEDPHTQAINAAPAVGVSDLEDVPLPLIPGRDEYHGHSPRVGEHSREVLQELGYDEKEVSELLEQGLLSEPS